MTALLQPRRNEALLSKGPIASFRSDLQGLRALAVVVVILDHLFKWPAGGFIGVDMFFVLSGFLITGLLLREYEKDGRISFLDFYKRRIKRLLPAALIVVVVTVFAAFLVLNQSRAKSVLWDGVSALLFAANWRQASLGTDYFQSSGPTSPLQHYWSLAVEEQFYLIWPCIILAAFAVASRRVVRWGNARIIVGVAIAIVTIASFAWSVHETAISPGTAYFSTFSRAWELGVGAFLALITPCLNTLPKTVRLLCTWVGLLGIIVSLFVISSEVPFPGPSAALPVLSTALVIAAGTGSGADKYPFVLSNKVSGYLGDISYSLYLWHFPVIILGMSILKDSSVLAYLGLLVAIFVLSAFSYHLVEDPIRKSPWLSGRRKWWRTVQVSNNYKNSAIAFLAIVTLTAVSSQLLPSEESNVAEPSRSSALDGAASKDVPRFGPEVTLLQTDISEALAATSWPELTPSLDTVIETGAEHPPGVLECGNVVAPAENECTFGREDAPKTAMIVGDSIAMSWVAALLPIYAQGDWKLQVRGFFACQFLDVKQFHEDKELRDNCAGHKDAVVKAVQQNPPDLLIVANAYYSPILEETGEWATFDERTDGMISILEQTKDAGHTLVLSAPPADKDIRECYVPGSVPLDCASKVTSNWRSISKSERSAAKRAGVSYLDTRLLFCNEGGSCPAYVRDTVVKYDTPHITLSYSEKVSLALEELLTESLKEHD